jgi:hypothetical protein
MGWRDWVPDVRSWNRWTWLRLVALTVLVAISVAAFLVLVVSGELEAIIVFIQGIGLWGNLLFVALFTLFGLPIPSGYTVLGMACGFIYGMASHPCAWSNGFCDIFILRSIFFFFFFFFFFFILFIFFFFFFHFYFVLLFIFFFFSYLILYLY